jgi:hypothetical protein
MQIKFMRQVVIAILIAIPIVACTQTSQAVKFNSDYTNIKIDRSAEMTYKLSLEKGGLYKMSVMQQGIDVVIILKDGDNKSLLEQDTPNGQNGLETFEYAPQKTGLYFISIKRLEENGNPDSGTVWMYIKKFTKAEIELKEKIKKELEPENNKTVQTLDIDHFWEAFDNLANCRTHTDSVASFQKIYLDRATNGLLAFMEARDITAGKLVVNVAHFPLFFRSIRNNTYEVKKAIPLIEEVAAKFKEIYPGFQPFKVCFAVGVLNSGGTISDNYVLIGAEITTSTKDVDLTEFNNDAFSKVLAGEDNIVQKMKNVVAHECVHTLQKTPYDKNAIGCGLLYSVMQEGFCDFISEIVTGGQINNVAHDYGNKHEKELWKEFKNEMCKDDAGNWLYNYSGVKDRPADLGYYIGYQIAKAYYQNAADKKQAISDIIEMNNPLHFLEISKYDQQEKK